MSKIISRRCQPDEECKAAPSDANHCETRRVYKGEGPSPSSSSFWAVVVMGHGKISSSL